MTDYEFIRNFGKIKISNICKENNIDVANVYNNRCSKDKIKIIREELEDRIARLYIKEKKRKCQLNRYTII